MHRRGLITERVEKYRTRHSFMTRWLHDYNARQSRQTASRQTNHTRSVDPASSEDNHPRPTETFDRADVLRKRRPQRRWDDVVGLRAAKQTLRETLPDHTLAALINAGAGRPWRSVLLYGPTGAGKRLLVEALATEARAEWVEGRGRCLGDIAEKVHAQTKGRCVVCVRAAETCTGWEEWHEWQEIEQGEERELVWVFVSARPWELREEVLGRLERKIYVGALGKEDRCVMMERLMRRVKHDVTLQEMEWLAAEAEYMTGRDMQKWIRDAEMETVRRVVHGEWFREREKDKWQVCERDDQGARRRRVEEVGVDNVEMHNVSCLDLEVGMEAAKSCTTKELMERFDTFTRRFGMDGR